MSGVKTSVTYKLLRSPLSNSVPSTPRSIIINTGITIYNTAKKIKKGLNESTSLTYSTRHKIMMVKNRAKNAHTLVSKPSNITTANTMAVMVLVLKVFLSNATLKLNSGWAVYLQMNEKDLLWPLGFAPWLKF